MDRKRAHELQTHRLVSSGAGASAVSRNTFRAPTEPAAGTWAEQDRLRPAGSPQDRQASREPRRPLRWPRRVSAPCGMRSVQTFDTVAALQGQARSVILLIERATCTKTWLAKNEWHARARARIRVAGRTLPTSPPALEAFVGRRRGRARCIWETEAVREMQTRCGLNAQARHPAFLRRRPP